MMSGYQQYAQQSVQTAAPDKLLIMLFDGAIRFSKQAIQAIEQKRPAEAHSAIIRVQDIITEFMVTLNMEYEIAKNLMALYDYMKHRLIQANIKKDPEPVKEVLGMLEELRDSFSQAAIKAKAGSTAKVVGGVNFQG